MEEGCDDLDVTNNNLKATILNLALFKCYRNLIGVKYVIKPSNSFYKNAHIMSEFLKSDKYHIFCFYIKHALIINATCWPKSVSVGRDSLIQVIRKLVMKRFKKKFSS